MRFASTWIFSRRTTASGSNARLRHEGVSHFGFALFLLVVPGQNGLQLPVAFEMPDNLTLVRGAISRCGMARSFNSRFSDQLCVALSGSRCSIPCPRCLSTIIRASSTRYVEPIGTGL
ncbi:hypothetical protein BVI434_630022 [Burkholderia vietnamiensis]|nr:hypothetical protein BVI434_630022 [Burkholderia vietnamiensis]